MHQKIPPYPQPNNASIDYRKLASDPEYQFLRAHWPDLPCVSRAEQVASLEQRGYSQRALARGLGVDEGTIRRDLEVSRLSQENKDRIRNGESVAAVLEAEKRPVTELQRHKEDRGAWMVRVFEDARKQMKEIQRIERLDAEAMRLGPKAP